MTLPVVNSAEVQTLSGATWTVTLPAGAASGDLLYVTFNCNAGAGVQDVVTPPTGWVQVFDSEGATTGNGWQEAWYRILPGSPPATFDFGMLSSRAGRAHVMVVDAGTFDASTPIEDFAQATQSSGTAFAIPAVDAVSDALLVAAAAVAGSGPTWTPDPTYTEQTDHANGTTSSMGTGTRAVSGGTGLTATWTSSAADNGTVSHVVIKGAGGGGGGVSAYDTLVLSRPTLVAYYPLASDATDAEGTADGVASNVTFGQPALITSVDAADESAQFDGISGGVTPSGSGGYAAVVSGDSPVHYWRMGEASGNLVDSVGTAHGTSSGTVTRNVTGLINSTDDDGGVDFGGGYFNLADAMASLDTTWSLEAWVTVDAVTDGGYFLYFFDGSNNALALGYGAAGEPFLRWDDGVSGHVITGPPLAIGQTYHVVGTHDGTTARLFVNGVEVADDNFGSFSYGSMSSWTRRIGAPNNTAAPYPHDGKLDELAVYDTTLTPAQILEHYNTGFGGTSSIPALGTSWSVEVWVQPDAASLTDREYFVSGHIGSASVLSLFRFGDEGQVAFSWNDSGDVGHTIGGQILSADLPHHLVATHDGTTGTLYHNGVVLAEAAFNSKDLTTAVMWKLGAWSASDQDVLAGRMQKVAFYSDALSVDDIRDHYELGTGSVIFGSIDAIAPAAQSEGTATVVYHATGDAIHAVPELAGAIETEESILSAVGASVAIAWDVRALAGKSLAIAYTVAGEGGSELEYDETGLSYDDSLSTYDGVAIAVVSAVGRDLAISWNVATTVGKSVAVVWNVRAAVGRDLVLRYNVLAIVVLEPVARFEIDWDGSGFEFLEATEDISFNWNRGAGTDLESQTPGSATLVLYNEDDRYTDTNTASDLYERIRPNARLRASMDFDGNLRPLWSGYLTDMAPNVDIPEVELVFDDLLQRLGNIEVNVPPEVGRSFGEYRLEVLTAAGVPSQEISLDNENEVMVDTGGFGSGTALFLLEAINTATGTRHFIRPGAGDPWQQYVTVNRQHKLTQPVFDIDLHKTPQIHVGSGGWRTAWDTVVNRQRISVPGEVQYPNESEEIWVADNMPIGMSPNTSVDVWAENTGPIMDVFALVFGPGITTQLPTAYADSVKVTVNAGPGGATITSLAVWGRPGSSGNSTTVTEENALSIATYGRNDATRNASGSLPSTAKGIAQHIVWRYGEPRKQPRATHSDPPAHYVGRDLFDLVGFNMAAVFVSDRRMELIGEDGSLNRGLLTLTWQMQDTPEQDPSTWFILGTSALNSTAILGY